MELQLALLLAGIIAFSDSARGKGTALGAITLGLSPFPLLHKPTAPPQGPPRELLSAGTRPLHIFYLHRGAGWCPHVVLPYLRGLGLSFGMGRGRRGFAEVC